MFFIFIHKQFIIKILKSLKNTLDLIKCADLVPGYSGYKFVNLAQW